MRRIAWIDPLRGLAAFAVLVSHVAYWSGGSSVDGVGRLLARGDVGVAVFFAVSACLLTRGACAGRGPIAHYARKRAARIVPAYVVALGAAVLVAWWLGTGEATWPSLVSHVLLMQAYTGHSLRGFTQAWSVTTEVTFYCLVPALCAWLRRCRAHDTSPLPFLIGGACIGLGVQALSASSGVAHLGALSTSVLGHLAWFAVGIACAWGEAQARAGRSRKGDGSRSLTPMSAIGWAASAYVLVATPLGGPIHLETPTVLSALAKESLYALIAGLLVWACVTARTQPAGGQPETVGEAGERPWMQTLGDLSYGVFLWHVLVLQVLFASLHLRLFHAPFLLVLVVTVVVSVALARVSWSVIERPAIRWAHREGRNSARAARTR